MKASEMTNEELAKELLSRVPLDSNSHDDLREAAKRLRAFSALTTRTDNSEVIAELERRLKVAEDALAELQTRCVASVHDGTIDPYEALKIAEDALAAIRGEGVAK